VPAVVGLNCALGGKQLRPYIEELAQIADTYVCAYPNAGLPNAFGEYDETPQQTAEILGEFAASGFVNMVGGCCGTTPEHIRAVVGAVSHLPPRALTNNSERSALRAARTRHIHASMFSQRARRQVRDGADHGANVLWRGAATATHHIDETAGREFAQDFGGLLGGFVVFAECVRQSRVRVGAHIGIRDLRQLLDIRTQLLAAERAN